MTMMTTAISTPMTLRRPGSRPRPRSGPAPPTAAPSAAATPADPAVAIAIAIAIATAFATVVVLPVVVVVFRHPSPSAAICATSLAVVAVVGQFRFEDDGVRWAHRWCASCCGVLTLNSFFFQ